MQSNFQPLHALFIHSRNNVGRRVCCTGSSYIRKTVRHVHNCNHVLNEPLVFRDITEQDIESKLMISKVGSPPLDILIRTSGVKRLSDYMLWQVRVLFC